MNPIALGGPSVEPVPLAAMKTYLRVDGAEEDLLIEALVMAARAAIEEQTRLRLLAQRWRVRLDAWPADRLVPLTLWPILSVEAIRIRAKAGTEVLVEPARYWLDASADPARLRVESDVPDPEPGGRIEIDLVCGFGTDPASVPQPLVLCAQRLVAHWFEHRGDQTRDDTATRGVPALPAELLALLAPYRRARLA